MLFVDINIVVQGMICCKCLWLLGVFVLIVVYLVYVVIVFDLGGLVGWVCWDNGMLMVQDFWFYKVYVICDNCSQNIFVLIEGMCNVIFVFDQCFGWIIDMVSGMYVVLLQGNSVDFGFEGLVVLIMLDG